MAFLNPWLLFGTLGVAVPIIIHLLNRYRHRQVDWGAMELLRRALVVRSRQVQIEDLILLALRCLAVLLLALAIARPTITSGVFGKNAQAGVVIAIDGSYSMGHKPAVSSRFDTAVQRAREILKTVNPGDPVTIVLMGNFPRVWQITYDQERVSEVLKKLAPLPEELNLEACLTDRFKGVRTMMFDMKAGAKECYIISDAQEITWGHPSDVTRQALRDIASRGKVYFVSAGSDNSENLGITRFEVGGGAVRKGSIARYDVEVRNFGRLPAKGVTVDLMAGDARVDRRVMENLPPGESQTVPLFVRFDKAGTYRLKAHIGIDALTADNDRYAAVTVRDNIKVLVIDGRPSNQLFRSASGFLQTALSPKMVLSGRDPSVPRISGETIIMKTISWLDLAGQRLTDFDLIIMADVQNIHSDDVPGLCNFVRNGGGLIVFLGPSVNVEFYNKYMVAQEAPDKTAPLLPAALAEVVKADAANPLGWPMEVAAPHPLSKAAARMSSGLLGETLFQDYYKLKLYPDGHPILKITRDGSPLLAEKPLGEGKVLMFASTANLDWNNFMREPIGPILVNDALTYLTTPALDAPLKVGDKLSVTLPRQSNLSTVVFRDPLAADRPVKVAEVSGRKVAELSDPVDAAGFYEVQSGVGPPLVAAVNVAPAEGEVRCVDTAAMTVPLAGTDVRVMADGADIASVITQGRVGRELWRWLMMLGLAALVVELFLARYFAKRIARVETAETAAGRREQLLAEKA
ncbi:MAG: BatA domain-containing protein [Phycisphaerae bacterium]